MIRQANASRGNTTDNEEVIGEGTRGETSDHEHMEAGHDEQGETTWEDEAEAAKAFG